MKIVEGERLHAFIGQFFHGGANFGYIFLVHHLVRFQVKRPVARAVEQRDGFLLAVNKTLHAVIGTDVFVPLRG